MKRHSMLLAPVVAAALALGACSAETEPALDEPTAANESPVSSASTSASSTSTEATTDVSPAAAQAAAAKPVAEGFTLEDTHIRSEQPAEMMIEDVRAGAHDGFDRLVVELSGTGSPSVIAGYEADPRQQASGYELRPVGNAFFTLLIQGVPLSMSADDEIVAKSDPSGVAAGNIVGVADGGVFEADAQYVVGLNAQRPYKLTVLDNPTRVVVDFQK